MFEKLKFKIADYFGDHSFEMKWNVTSGQQIRTKTLDSIRKSNNQNILKCFVNRTNGELEPRQQNLELEIFPFGSGKIKLKNHSILFKEYDKRISPEWYIKRILEVSDIDLLQVSGTIDIFNSNPEFKLKIKIINGIVWKSLLTDVKTLEQK